MGTGRACHAKSGLKFEGRLGVQQHPWIPPRAYGEERAKHAPTVRISRESRGEYRVHVAVVRRRVWAQSWSEYCLGARIISLT